MAEELEYDAPEPTAEATAEDMFAAAMEAAEESQPVTTPDEEEVAEEADEVPEAEPSDEPSASAEMLAVARLAGVPEELLVVARDNTAVSTLIDFFSKQPQPQESKEEQREVGDADDLSLKDFLADEYDDGDPVHKQLRHVIDVVNKQRQEERKTLQLLLAHANQQLQERQQTEAMAFQKPFDNGLDELDNPAFGNSEKGLTDAQIRMRSAAFKAYLSLVDGEPEDRRAEIAQAAVKAKYAKLFPERKAPAAVDKRVKQAMKRLGGSPGGSAMETLSAEEQFAQALKSLAM
jgi:hypothetical protein